MTLWHNYRRMFSRIKRPPNMTSSGAMTSFLGGDNALFDKFWQFWRFWGHNFDQICPNQTKCGMGVGPSVVDKISMLVAMCDIIQQICDVIISEKMTNFGDFRPTIRGYNSWLGRVRVKPKVYLESLEPALSVHIIFKGIIGWIAILRSLARNIPEK